MPKRPKSDLSSEAILKRVGRRDKEEGPRDKAWTDELTKWVFANETVEAWTQIRLLLRAPGKTVSSQVLAERI